MTEAFVLWFSGLSGSGKTTIANELYQCLTKNEHRKVKILDGDVIRNTIHGHLGFSPEDIKENNFLIAKLCVKYKNEYDVIIVPIISPFIESRQRARRIIGDRFFEVYVKSSLETLIKRDVKGLYKKAQSGELPSFIGVDPITSYEPPSKPDIVVDTETEDVKCSTTKLVEFLHQHMKADESPE